MQKDRKRPDQSEFSEAVIRTTARQRDDWHSGQRNRSMIGSFRHVSSAACLQANLDFALDILCDLRDEGIIRHQG